MNDTTDDQKAVARQRSERSSLRRLAMRSTLRMDRLNVAETCRQNARLLTARGDANGARRWYRRAAEAQREANELTAPHSVGDEPPLAKPSKP